MTSFLGLRTLVFAVPDLAAAKDWYAKVVEAPPYFDEPFYVGFSVGGYELGLMPLEGDAPLGARTLVYLGVEDAGAAYARLLALGAKPHAEPADVGDGIVVATVLDPWGNVLGVIRNPHFGNPLPSGGEGQG